LDDFDFLEKGMSYKQVIEVLGEPQDVIKGSSAITTVVYEIEEGSLVYLFFLTEADYLDGVYYLYHLR
jgi:hypothetical protein